MSRLKNRDYRDYVADIHEEIIRIQGFVDGIGYDEFLSDFRTNYAVMKALENMGEAAKKIPESLRTKYSAIPFKEMAGLRDVVTHNYDGISYDMIWEVIKKDIPGFLPELEIMMDALEDLNNRQCPR